MADFMAVVEEAWKKDVRSSRPDWVFRDRLKNVKVKLRGWSKERFGGHKEKMEKLKNEAMRWELEAETRALSDNERGSWLEARKQWEDKEREYGNMLRQKSRIKWDIEDVYLIQRLIFDGLNLVMIGRPRLEDENAPGRLEDLMKRMGFREKWCKWVEICLRSASMAILVNGSPSEEFGLKRGVRQGDPLSPFLFILAAEGLNAIVTEAVEKGIFRGVVVRENKVTVSHLQYADNTIFFGEWNKENAKALMCILKCFEEVSGLKVNYNKSKIYGIGVNEGDMMDMERWMGCGIGEFPFTWACQLGSSLWVRVIKSIHGTSGGLGDGRDMRGGRSGGGVMSRIIRFWVDNKWVDNRRVVMIHLSYSLDRRKGGQSWDKGFRYKMLVFNSNCAENKWRWLLGEDGEFTVKDLAILVEEKNPYVENRGHETLWNRLVPEKVNIFVWRALKGRLPVRVELDRRGIDLDSILCPCCNDIVETCAHCLVTCDLAMSVWVKVFNWWRVGSANAFSIDELFSSNGSVNVPTFLVRVWQAVIWTFGYFIWKERNARVFGQKVSSTNKIVQDIQLKSFEWITRRSNKYNELDWQQWLWEPLKIQI
ncbi:reverse transcriptase domain, reverse transcriptase zinc-binding domain protein [Tanacetum coccineum]